MSISKCMICTKDRRSIQEYHHLFTSGCIECSTRIWQEQNSTEKWQEICLTPGKVKHDKNSKKANTDADSLVPTTAKIQYLQIGYRPCKQPWRTKALHIFESFVRRRSSSAQNTGEQSKTSSEPPSGIETAQKRSEAECKALVEINQNSISALTNTRGNSNAGSGTHQQSITRVIGPENHNFDDGQESSLDVLALMHTTGPVPASDQTLSLKCCCSDADLTKPSMCGDRACVTCSVHDHRLIARQVSMAAEAAAQAAVSVLAVPQATVDQDDLQGSYISTLTTPGNPDVQSVLHSVRSALETRLRSHRPEILKHQTDVATCTTPSTHDSTVNPILLSLGKMYQKNLYLSALLHNLSSLDVKRLVALVRDCRAKIEQLEEVCRQRSDTVLERRTVDESVGMEHKMVDAAVGDEDVKTKDKETQNAEIIKIDSQTETTYFGVEVGVQVFEEESGGRKPGDSIGSEEPWGRITAGLSNADFNSLNLTQSCLLEPFLMQFDDSPKPENGFTDVDGSSTDYRPQEPVSSKAQMKNSRLIKLAKQPIRPLIRKSLLLSYPPGPLRPKLARQTDRSHPHQSGPSAGIQKLYAPCLQHTTAVSARFAGGRSVINHSSTRRGLNGNKSYGSQFGVALRK